MIIDAIRLITMNLATSSNAIAIPPSDPAAGPSQAFTENTDEYIIFTDYTQDISWSNFIFSQTHFTIEQYNVFLAERILKSLNFLVTIIEVWVTFWPDFNWKILDHFSNHRPGWLARLSLEILINLKTMAPCWRLQYGVFLWIRTRSQNLMLPQEEIRGKPVFFADYIPPLKRKLYNCFTSKCKI